MSRFDFVLVGLGSLLLLGFWFQGYHKAADAAPTVTSAQAPALKAPRAILGGGGPAGSAAGLSLPPGVRIDQATGLLMGVVPPDIPGVEPMTWELLRTYEHQPGMKDLPESIAKLNGKRVVMIGFLMTLFEFDDIHEFHLVASHWSCCYGVPPGLESAVHVKLADGEEGLPNTMKPLRVIGTLRVGERKESGIIYAIYAIEDAEVVVMDY
jgi:hypothetical protein